MTFNNSSNTTLLVSHIQTRLDELLVPHGFEYAFFLTGWYNSAVSSKVKLSHDVAPFDDCLAVCLLNSPRMFDDTFLPMFAKWSQEWGVASIESQLKHLKSQFSHWPFTPNSTDYLDWTVFLIISNVLETMKTNLNNTFNRSDAAKLEHVMWIPDFAMKPVTRVPCVHVQSAGHVAGMTYFYQPTEDRSPKYFGCSLHPRYGGWFGFRGILVYPQIRCPNIERRKPKCLLDTDLIELLFFEFNEKCAENRWRSLGLDTDCIRYSKLAQSFFDTRLTERKQLLLEYLTTTQIEMS